MERASAEFGKFFVQFLNYLFRILKGLLMIKQDIFVSDRGNIVVENSGIDRFGCLAREDAALRGNLVKSGDGAGSFEALTGRIFAGRFLFKRFETVDE